MAKYSGSQLFSRKYRIIVGTEGTKGVEVSELHCSFEIEKSMSSTPNTSILKIFNLSQKTRNPIISEGSRVIIEAGYAGSQYGLIYDGDVVEVLAYKEDNVTHVTEIVSQDGDVFLNGGAISVSYGAGETAAGMVASLAKAGDDKAMALGAVSENLSGTKLARGKVMFGQPKDFLRKIAKGEGGMFYINDRKINLVKPTDLPKDEIVSLTPASGLIGTPEITNDGCTAKSLLNPLLNLNKLVHIKSTAGSGVFKIISLKHRGDTRGQDWYTEITGIAQPGSYPLTGKSY